jgi:hypothetical protein
VPACDPLTDNDALGSGTVVTACGSGRGCYGYPEPSGTHWTCLREGDATLVNASPCTFVNGCASVAPPTNSNGCAQGYEPFVYDTPGYSEIDCVALCTPGNTYAGNPTPQYPAGRSPHTCTNTDARGTFDTGSDGDHCVFSWWLERDATGTLMRSPTSDSVGLCVDHAKMGWPPCAGLPDGFGSPGAPGAADYGCVDSRHAGFP